MQSENRTLRLPREQQWMCPRCEDDVLGQAVSVMHSGGRQTLTFVCPVCGGKWDIITPERTLFERL
jgi:hypothetical protein